MITNKSKGFTQHHFSGSGINKNVSGNTSKNVKSGAGFTIVELLVVVAIIAVLASIVLVNVTAYINRGKNASIKANLSSVLVNGSVYFDANESYTGFCGTTGYTGPSAAIVAAGSSIATTCIDTTTATCACSTLNTTATEPTGSVFCVDSTGAKRQTSATTCAIQCLNTGACL